MKNILAALAVTAAMGATVANAEMLPASTDNCEGIFRPITVPSTSGFPSVLTVNNESRNCGFHANRALNDDGVWNGSAGEGEAGGDGSAAE